MNFGQSNSPQPSNLFSSSNNSLPSGGFPSMGQNTPFQGHDTFSGPTSGGSQQTQSAFVNRAFGPTSNTTTSGVAGTVPPFGVAGTVSPCGAVGTIAPFGVAGTVSPFGVARTVSPFGVVRTVSPFGVARTVSPFGVTSEKVFEPPSTSVFGPSSSTAFPTGQLSEPSGVSQFGPVGSPTFTPPSTTFRFEPSSSSAFTHGQLSQPSTNFPFEHSSSPAFTPDQLSQPLRNPFGSSSSPALTTGQQSQPSTNSPFGPSSSQAFTPGQLSHPSRTSPFGPYSSLSFPINQSPFQTTTVPSEAQTMRPPNGDSMFVQSTVSGTHGGTRVAAYARTAHTDNSSTQAGWLTSISAMPTYKDKSHEELKWEDYRITDKDKGLNSPMHRTSLNNPFSTIPSNIFTPNSTIPASQNSSLYRHFAFPPTKSTVPQPLSNPRLVPFSTSSTISQPLSNPAFLPFSTNSNVSQPLSSTTIAPFSTHSTVSQHFTSSSFLPFSTNSTVSEPFTSLSFVPFSTNSTVSQPFTSPSFVPFSTNSTVSQPFTSSSFLPFSTNSTVSKPFTSPSFVPFSTNSTVSQPFTSPSFVPFSTNSTVSHPFTSSSFVPFSTNSTVSQPLSSPAFVPSSTNSGFPNSQTCTPSLTPATFPSSNLCNIPSTEVVRNYVPVSQPLCPTCNQVNPGQPASFVFNFNQTTQNGETSEAIPKTSSGPNSVETLARVANQNIFSQVSAAPVTEEKQPSPVISSFETLTAAVPQLSFDRYQSASPIQHGISNMHMTNKHTSVKRSALKTTRRLSQGRIKLPVRKYNPKTDGQKVPFFSEEELPRPPNADAYFNPRDNPRSWISGTKFKADKSLPVENGIDSVNDIGNTDNFIEEHMGNLISRLSTTHDGEYDVEYTSIKLTNRESSDTPVAQEQDTDVESLMPKLKNCEYYTEPSIKNLAAMEKAEPGFCSRVKDFVVGNHTYGYIKFPGETDVRNLDLESTIQFNNREVIVYNDEAKRPPVGEGLNKFAEVTLLNVTCLDKKTGKPCMDEAKIDKYKALLTRKAKEQGAEFLSFNPARGEWKFSVPHFG